MSTVLRSTDVRCLAEQRMSGSLGRGQPLSLFSPVARSILRLAKRGRHFWLRTKIGVRSRSFARRSVLRVRQLVFYRPPNERLSCPACGSTPVRHLQPLPYSRPISYEWKYGFISGCDRCGVVFANPLPAPDELERLYSPAGGWGRHRAGEEEKSVSRGRLEQLFAAIRHQLDVLNPPPNSRVLDIGCGRGGMLDALAARGWTTYGLDPATTIAFRRHRQVTTIPSSPQFQLVILHHVLEHVSEPLVMLRSAANAACQGGYLLVSVPNLDAMADHGDFKYCIRSHTHILGYTSACLRWLLASAGFEVLSIVDRSHGAPAPTARLVVIARRTDDPVDRPDQPLTAARTALERYFALQHVRPVAPGWPVRLRAALANLTRGQTALRSLGLNRQP